MSINESSSAPAKIYSSESSYQDENRNNSANNDKRSITSTSQDKKLKEYIKSSIEGAKKRDARNNQSVYEGLVAGAEWREKEYGRADLSEDLEK